MTVELMRYPTDDDWNDVKLRALVTSGFTKVKTAPTAEWKDKMLNCRHSPIRDLRFSFYIMDMPYWLSTELSRHHEGCEKYIKSQRNDRQNNYDRNAARQDSPVNMIFDCNAESLMVVMNKRLCGRASKEMRELMHEIRELVVDKCPEFKPYLVPNCFYNGGVCHEMQCCGYNIAYGVKK